jgi:transcriptional regulator with XRE-family HTH domain
MSKTIHSPEHQVLCELLVAARRKAGMTQLEVAAKLERPQSFLAKVEGGERRLDVIEFIHLMRALGADPVKLMRSLIASVDAASG